jgi:hypothetical protein
VASAPASSDRLPLATVSVSVSLVSIWLDRLGFLAFRLLRKAEWGRVRTAA